MERTIASAKIKKGYDGEWIVQAYDSDGKRIPEADYFTNDKQDAIDTAKLMTN